MAQKGSTPVFKKLHTPQNLSESAGVCRCFWALPVPGVAGGMNAFIKSRVPQVNPPKLAQPILW